MPKNFDGVSKGDESLPLRSGTPSPASRRCSGRCKCITFFALLLAAVAGVLWPKTPKVSFSVQNFLKVLRGSDSNSMEFNLSSRTFTVNTQVPLDVRNNNVLPLHASVHGDIYYPGGSGKDGVLIASSSTEDIQVPPMSLVEVLLNVDGYVSPTFSQGLSMFSAFTSDCGSCLGKTKAECEALALSTTFFVDAIIEPEYTPDVLPDFEAMFTFGVPCEVVYPF